MLRVSTYDFFSFYVRKIVFENFLAEQIDESLYVFCHFLFGLCLFKGTEIDIWECTFKELNVKLITEKYRNILDGLFHAKIGEDLVSEIQNCLNDFIKIQD